MLGAPWFTQVGQEGLGKVVHRPKMTHGKGVACFMVPKSGVGRAWERSK